MAAPFPADTSTRHLGQNELARRWGISPRTLERWRSASEGPTYLKLGGSVAYRLEDVLAYEAAQRRTTQAEAEQTLSKAERFARGMPG
jgi:predicted DNA-binding transcriptional regulator AlpA